MAEQTQQPQGDTRLLLFGEAVTVIWANGHREHTFYRRTLDDGRVVVRHGYEDWEAVAGPLDTIRTGWR